MSHVAVNRVSRHEARWWVAVAALAGLLIGALIGPALAVGQSPPGQSTAAEAQEHAVSVTGKGTVFVTPDLAEVSLGVQLRRPWLRAARDDAAQIMNAVLSAVRNLGVADADIQTTMLNISPVYDYSIDQTARITGYQVTNIVDVTVRDLDLLAAVIDDCVAAGATTVNGVTFRVADPGTAERVAREAAVRDARARADALAGAAGVSITGVASIVESFSAPWDWSGGDRSGGEPPTPVMPGTAQVSVTVAMEFVIE
ncbi:MAG: SIMPL domain-containing protein [Chloroflexota bacterium]